ncbi:signal recognition particle-docking protein FtsY [Thioflexithrix psekupsensis]|uniref:Signal recognition particle receptor FtsY n=1 Tax=Thioflexithrix psekupsensis TaxID=1570016 RepID=A0A251XC96_9GAMM|nr:signal recognition particle-docking protein FtsY [Thioflexithrix psekupsensis]OUD15666.1 signal recognition particle-docking protein FtsY [Thioflexithrix psekupsensis]
MFGFGKNKTPETVAETEVVSTPNVSTEETPRRSWLQRLKQGLSRTRHSLSQGLQNLILGRKTIDDDLLDEIETLLLSADVGVDATQTLINGLTQRLSRKELTDPQSLFNTLKADMTAIIAPVTQPLVIPPRAESGKPYVILMVGVNGAGKTTTIGKLAHYYQHQGLSVLLAAGDTFRAAAVEQLQVWGERNQVPVIAQSGRADSASVIFDGLQAATSRGVDVLIADTAGRLQTKDNLMEELKKVKRVLNKIDPQAPHEVLLVLDAGTGQNALSQARLFHQAVAVSGIALTKLDGTAKGGIVFAVAQQLKLPIRFIGVGEGIDDLRPFVAEEFVDALFNRESAA